MVTNHNEGKIPVISENSIKKHMITITIDERLIEENVQNDQQEVCIYIPAQNMILGGFHIYILCYYNTFPGFLC